MALIATVGFPPVGTFFNNVAYPEQGLDVVDKRGAAKEANLVGVWGLVARISRLPSMLSRSDDSSPQT
jgi:hypothetical protein